ncbi:Uncharacterised protein [Moraxella caprae]|uniref:DUF7210 domain-containing protein n=1 Tax=Moraxella caprae TaxID=90240 RepID=A0A378R0P4_9GAMM|nr:hypothetical protein [Moraxella caprae]STZ08598.1 Uncharacterised protein [Moraxella caprae]
MSQTNQTVTEIQVTLLKNHTRAGQSYQANDTLSVSQTTADWLIKNDIAELKADDKAEPTKPKTKEKELLNDNRS